jgi:hypothetical protein
MARRSHRSGEWYVGEDQPDSDDKEKGEGKAGGPEGGGPRFKKGSEDLDQLEGIEQQQDRSRKARRLHEQANSSDDPDPEELGPLIDDIEKSRQRLKNRFKGIKKPEDAIDEFDS